MLLDLREYVRNSKPVKYTLITIISIPFVFVGIGSYLSGGGSNHAATIDGEKIGIREFDQAYLQQRQQLSQMFGGTIPEGFANEPQLRQQALESLLTQQALRNVVNNAKFTVSDSSLAQAIQEVPGFQVEGQFDNERYRAQLLSSGMSVDQFEDSFRNDTAMAQFRSGIVDTAFELKSEQSRIDELNRQARKIDSVVLPIEDVAAAIEVTDEDIQTYFDDKASEFNFPERVKIEYISLGVDELASEVEITDEDAQTHYDDNKSSYVVAEERKASHILLKPEQGNAEELEAAKQQLLDIRSRVEAGEELSEPVESDFGVHLILLEGIIEEHGAAFEDVKPDIISQLQTNQASTEYNDLIETLTEQSYDNPESLDVAADATGLEIKTSEWIDGTENSDPNPQLANPQILSMALSEDVLQEGNNSDVIPVGDKQNIVLRVLEHEEPRPKTLDDVREDISDTLKNERAAEQLDASLADIKTLIADGEDPAEKVEELGGSYTVDQELIRTSTDLDRSVIGTLFELPRPENDKPVLEESVLPNGDRVLLVLKEVLLPSVVEEEVETESKSEEPESDAPAAAPSANRGPQFGNNDFTAMLRSLRAAAKVEVNEQLLSQYGESGVAQQ